MRKLFAWLLPSIVLATAWAGHRADSVARGAPAPRLVVVIAADGLSWDRLQSWRPWYTSGLKRLLDEGAVATECRYDHLVTETAPGHASIATGAPPRVHGIAHNEWFVPSPDGARMTSIYSASQPLPGESEDSPKTIPGPGRLRVATLGDRLVARDARSKVVSISTKDRAAIFLAGRDPRHAVYWYAPKTGIYETSAAYDAASPTGAAAARVVARFNAAKAGAQLAAHLGTSWSRLPVPDPPPEPGFESGLESYQDSIVGARFPHDLAKARLPFPEVLPWSPFADRLMADLALDILADEELALGRDDAPDLLALSFSANDYVSHHYGPESVEDLEVLRALDLEIGRLLDDLTVRFGKGRVVVALSSDHGFLPLPEATARRQPPAGRTRVSDRRLVDELNRAVDAELKRTGAPPLIQAIAGCSLWLDRTKLAGVGAPYVKRVLEIVRHELATSWNDVVLRTFVVADGIHARRADDVARRAWNSLVPGRSGDLFVVPRRDVLIDPYDGKGSSHGSPWDHDTHVPLIIWGGGVPPRPIAMPSTPCDLAPTLASRIGVTMPDATGTPLKF